MRNKRLEARFDWAANRLRMLLKEINRFPYPERINEDIVQQAFSHVRQGLNLLQRVLDEAEGVQEDWERQPTKG